MEDLNDQVKKYLRSNRHVTLQDIMIKFGLDRLSAMKIMKEFEMDGALAPSSIEYELNGAVKKIYNGDSTATEMEIRDPYQSLYERSEIECADNDDLDDRQARDVSIFVGTLNNILSLNETWSREGELSPKGILPDNEESRESSNKISNPDWRIIKEVLRLIINKDEANSTMLEDAFQFKDAKAKKILEFLEKLGFIKPDKDYQYKVNITPQEFKLLFNESLQT